MPQISIITVTYNAGKKLEATIQSVIKQNFRDLEYIIVDGGSSDSTLEIIKKYAISGGVTKWISEPDRGIYDAMNKGISLSSGIYLYFLQAGDCLRPEILNKMCKFFETGNSWLLYGDVWWNGKRYAGPFSKWKLSVKNICQQAIFYHKKVFEKFGVHDIRYVVVADHILNFKVFASKEANPVYVNEIVADFEDGGFSGAYRDILYEKNRFSILYSEFGLFVCLYSMIYNCLRCGYLCGKRLVRYFHR